MNRPSLAIRLRERLPEILIEAASVVVALLLALAINNWSEERQQTLRADAARAAILVELQENRSELAGVQPNIRATLESLRAAVSSEAPQPKELRVELDIALLSSAAWQAAATTRASQSIDLAWITRMAKVYELQENFQRVQNLAVDQLGSIAPENGMDGREIALSMIPRLNALAQIADGLMQDYDRALASPRN
ncbi:hypothetical protein [Dokdonella sp.]|uniref:hypothetical protein n=1 Tax=Dokdonella sp. TaxID=2291710 RepID=UPI0035282E64